METGLGLRPKESAGLETYKKGQWVRFKVNGQLYYGVFSKIHNGELLLSKITEVVQTEKGDELCIVEKEAGIPLSHITIYRKSSRKEAGRAIENYLPYFQYFEQYVTLPAASTTYCGRIVKVNYEAVSLCPALHFKNGKAYIEEERPLIVKTSTVNSILPSSREDLEHRVREFLKQFEQAEQQKIKGKQKRKA